MNYAEQHYKFRLPGSFLHRSRPELIVDAPHLLCGDRPLPLWLVVHDAHLFPRRLRSVRVTVRGGGELRTVTEDPDLLLDLPFRSIPLPMPELPPGEALLLDAVFQVEDARGHLEVFRNHSLPGLPHESLRILHIPAHPFPAGWVSGDLHCHSFWSQDQVEFGGDPAVMRTAAKALGLDFFALCDHSYDFAWMRPDYMRPADPDAAFARFRASLSADAAGEPLVLPGEELSCGSCHDKNVHLLVLDHPDYFPGQGDGGRRWFRNRPDLSLAQVLECTAAAGTLTYAAHPKPSLSRAERLIFRRGDYHTADMLPGLTGLQFWNGGTGEDFCRGRNFWKQQVLSGKHLRPAAGNDAHGDLSCCTHVRIPLLRLGLDRRHVFGGARTWLQLKDGTTLDRAGLHRALQEAPCVLSDGPFLHLSASGHLHGTSLPAFGNWKNLCVRAVTGNRTETIFQGGQSLEIDESLSLPAGAVFLFAEGETTLGRHALTDLIPLA